MGHEHAPEGSRVTALAFGHSSSCRVGLTGLTSRSVRLTSAVPGGPDARRRRSRALGRMVERMPLTKAPDSSVEYVLANSTASSMTTASVGRRGRQQLGHGQAQDEAVDHGHALERPADRGGGDAAIGLGPAGRRVVQERAHVGIGRHGEAVDHRDGVRALELGLVEEGQRPLAPCRCARSAWRSGRRSSAAPRPARPGSGTRRSGCPP